MSTLIILFAQNKGEAIIEILLLLIIAAVIGYITAWLFYKSIYKKRIKVLEHEKHEFNNRIVNLNAEISSLNKKISESVKKTDQLKLKVGALKALHREAVNETDVAKLEKNRTEELLYKNDETLTYLLRGKNLLDYKSFGTAKKSEKDDLKMISGIGPVIEGRLHTLEIYTFRQISKFTPRDIETIDDAIIYFTGRIEHDQWVAQAKELLKSEAERNGLLEKIRLRKALIEYNRIGVAKLEEADDLSIISGIGGWIKEKLNALDIFTFKQISNFTNDDVRTVTDAIEFFPGRIERDEWIQQAKQLVLNVGKKIELQKSIQAMKEKIDFERISMAYQHQANNLTLINGIGNWSEERLNDLGIYTFNQISKLTPSDIEIIAEVLNISTERILKHFWISQATKLANSHKAATIFTKN